MAALAVARAPHASGVDDARSYFADAGFSVGPTVGTSFSIAGPEPLMRRTFPGFDPAAGGEQELQLDELPNGVADALQTVVVEAPPDFGPGNP